jgi:hypothetical protein
MIIFEGKADGGSTWDRILSQLQGYAEIYVRRNGQFIYMVGARAGRAGSVGKERVMLFQGRAWCIV